MWSNVQGQISKSGCGIHKRDLHHIGLGDGQKQERNKSGKNAIAMWDRRCKALMLDRVNITFGNANRVCDLWTGQGKHAESSDQLT